MSSEGKVKLIAESTLKGDRIDAEVLARLSLYDRGFLHSVYQRSEGARLLRTRHRIWVTGDAFRPFPQGV
jgi:hypothetical protein